VRSILVLRGGALGDFLLTLPSLHLLRQRWPDARIELVGNRTAAELAVGAGLLAAVHSRDEARWAGLYAEGGPPPELRRFLADFDVIVSYLPDPDGDLSRVLPCRPGQRFLALDATPVDRPAWRHLAEPLAHAIGLGGLPPLPSQLLPLRTPAGAARPIAVHPGSGSARKNWPAERWEALVEVLAPEPVLVVLGEAEEAIAPRWRALAGGRIDLVDSRSLPEVAAALAGCRVFIGHDTGVGHLAAALGVPCVLLFGPTDPATWAPPGPGVVTLRRGPEVASVTLADVLAALEPRSPAGAGPKARSLCGRGR
jgi:heptosyltransferase III